MVPVLSLWLPILVAAVLVFAASSLIHTLLGYHANDYARLPDEDRVMSALGGVPLPPGDYVMPWAASTKDMQTPEYQEKLNRGPVAFMTVRPSGPFNMGAQFALWFAFTLLVGFFVAYVASRMLGPGAAAKDIFQVVGTTAFMGYALGQWQESIWFSRQWSTTLKNTLDGAIYAVVTAGAFAWLWPG